MPHHARVTVRSPHGISETEALLLSQVATRGLVLLARIDHAAAARAVGQRSAPSILFLFGDPAATTPLMRAAPEIALDTPLKVLLWRDEDGASLMTFEAPAAIAARHGLDGGEAPRIEQLAATLQAVVEAVAQAPPPAPAAGADATARNMASQGLLTRMLTGGVAFPADEPESVGGTALGPSPFDLLCAALAACTSMTLRLYAARKGWPMTAIEVAVSHTREAEVKPADRFDRRIHLSGALDAEQRMRLMQIADNCPVHRTLTMGARVLTEPMAEGVEAV